MGGLTIDRTYDPTTGTFLSPDPLMASPYGTEEATTTAANAYHYVSNDPLNFTDPLGLCRTTDVYFDPYQDGAVVQGPEGGLDWGGCEGHNDVTCTSQPFVESLGALAGTVRCGPSDGNYNIFGWVPDCFSWQEHCVSYKERYPGLYQGLVVVAVVAGGYWAVATLGPQAAAACAARSNLCWGLINGSAAAPAAGSSSVSSGGVTVNVERLQLTRTAANHAGSRPYVNSSLTIRQIVGAGSPVPDPQGAANAYRWDVPGVYNGSRGSRPVMWWK